MSTTQQQELFNQLFVDFGGNGASPSEIWAFVKNQLLNNSDQVVPSLPYETDPEVSHSDIDTTIEVDDSFGF